MTTAMAAMVKITTYAGGMPNHSIGGDGVGVGVGAAKTSRSAVSLQAELK